jgi:hypothetical protein
VAFSASIEPEGAHRVPSSFAKKALGLFQDFSLLTEDPVLSPESSEFLTLFGGETLSLAAVDLCLLDPVTECLVRDA